MDDSGGFKPLILHWDGSEWSQVESPTIESDDTLLIALAAVSANDIWAVGSFTMDDKTSGDVWFALIEHWDGKQWSTVSSPNPGLRQNLLSGVAAVSTDDVWAVGSYRNSQKDGTWGSLQTLTMHWDGGEWNVVPSPNPGVNSPFNDLRDVTSVTRDDVWAVGSYLPQFGVGVPYQTLTMHWDGSQWSLVPSPNIGTENNELAGVAATSAQDVWAVGNYCPTECDNVAGHSPLTMHWDGSRWNAETVDVSSSDSYLRSIAMVPGVPKAEVWAVGEMRSDSLLVDQTLVAYRDRGPEEAPPVVVATPIPTSEPLGGAGPGMPRTGAGRDNTALHLALLSLLGLLLLLVGVSLYRGDPHALSKR